MTLQSKSFLPFRQGPSFGGWRHHLPPAKAVGLWALGSVPHDSTGKRREVYSAPLGESPAERDRGWLWRPCIGPPSQPKLALNLPMKGPSFWSADRVGGQFSRKVSVEITLQSKSFLPFRQGLFSVWRHRPHRSKASTTLLRNLPPEGGYILIARRALPHPLNPLNLLNPLNPHAQRACP